MLLYGCRSRLPVYGASQGASRQELLDSLIGQAANSIQMAQENWGRTSWITFQLTDIYNNKGLSAVDLRTANTIFERNSIAPYRCAQSRFLEAIQEELDL